MHRVKVPLTADMHYAPDVLPALLQVQQSGEATQAQLDAVTGIGQSSISETMHGVTDPRLSTVLRLAEALGCTLISLPDEVYTNRYFPAAPGPLPIKIEPEKRS